MSRTAFRALAAAIGFAAVGCSSGSPKPIAALASSEGAIRGAQEAGGESVPKAALHIQLAQEQRDHAVKEIDHGHNHRASLLLARAEADAELAIALTRAAHGTVEATEAQQKVETLKGGAQ